MSKKFNLAYILCMLLVYGACSKEGGGGENPPATTTPVTITATNFTATVAENMAQGSSLGTVQASASSGSLSYAIVSQSVTGALAVDATTGAITVGDAAAFDYETQTTLTATVRITAGTATREITITITLTDVAEVDVSQLTLWEGASMSFTKEDGADHQQEANQDRITDNVWITRGANGQIFNIVSEVSANSASSPADTEWARGSFDDIASLTFQSFRDATGGKPKNAVGQTFVVHLITDDVYLDLQLTSWSTGKQGGFAYNRTTRP